MTYEPALNYHGDWYTKGPGNGFNYYSGSLWPEFVCKDEADAHRVCRMLNIAFNAGVEHQRNKVKQALGL